MKSTTRLLLAALTLGLSAAAFVRAEDQPPPPATPPPPASPAAGEGQHRGGGRMSPEATLQRLSERLNLTDDQKAKILPLLQDQADQAKAIMRDESISREERREKMRPIMEATHEKIRALLTAEQQEKFDKMHDRGPGDRKGPPPPAGEQPPPPAQSQ